MFVKFKNKNYLIASLVGFFSKNREKKSGAVLVIVLLLLAFFSVLVADFLYQVRINSYLTFNEQEQVRAKALAKAGINAGQGILLHSAPFTRSYRGNFQNQFVNLFQCKCYTSSTLGGIFGGEEQKKTGTQEAPDSLCGEWSFSLQYPVEEDTLYIQITDEQAKINVNALVSYSGGGEEKGAKENPALRPIVDALIKFRAKETGMELTDKEVEAILSYLIDWLDFGSVEGALDRDLNEYYQDGDRLYANKNGPMDTVSELKMIPGINDQLYNALKDYFTVYPLDQASKGKSFSPKVNIHLANLGVVYALVKGASAQGERSALTEEEAMNYAVQIMKSGMDEKGFLRERDIPAELKQYLNQANFILDPTSPIPRTYRIISTAITGSGINYTIEAVVQAKPGSGSLKFLYWREG